MESAAHVRLATEADIPSLCELLAFLFTQEAEFTPDAQCQQRGLSMILRDKNVGRILVLDDGPRLLGMVSLLFIPSTALGQRVAILEDMVIHPERRNRGYGAQLIQAAIELARQEAIARITLLTDHDNVAAERFYARHGFAKSTMLPMRQRLPYT